MIALTNKCYYVDDYAENVKFSCKGVNRKQNSMSWERYVEALNGSIDKLQNTEFRLLGSGIATYTQYKLGLSTHCDKRVVAPDVIHTEPLR